MILDGSIYEKCYYSIYILICFFSKVALDLEDICDILKAVYQHNMFLVPYSLILHIKNMIFETFWIFPNA